MAFTPLTTRPELPLDDVMAALVSDETNPKELDPEELETYRRQLSALKRIVGSKMADTATKEHQYDEAFVTDYIDAVLANGFNLVETSLSDEPKLIDAQPLRRWTDLIAERVELSPFGRKKFKAPPLRVLRSNIARAKTLHDLRQSVRQMIGPLELYREHRTQQEQQAADSRETMNYIGSLLLEIEVNEKLLLERKRVLDEILAVYSEDDSDLAVLRNIESAKRQHKLSDTEAAKWFGVSRRKLQTLREKLVPLADQEDTLLVRARNALKTIRVWSCPDQQLTQHCTPRLGSAA